MASSMGVSRTLIAGIVVLLLVILAAAFMMMGQEGAPATTTTSPATQAREAAETVTEATETRATETQETGTGQEAQATETGMGQVKVLVLFDVGGKGDLSFNDMAVLGAERAAEELGVQVDYQTPASVDAMESLLRSVSRGGEYDLIIGVGFLWLEPIVNVAPDFPEQKYAIIDAAPPEKIDNVAAFVFREQEVAALMGILAADMAKSIGATQVGAVAGMDIPPLWKFHIGYLYGVKLYNEETGSDIGFLWTYTGTFTDPQVGKQTAEQMIAQDARVLYGVAGLTHVGMFDAVKDANARGVKALAIGQDASQEWYAPEYIVVSGMKRVDTAVYMAIKSVVDGTYSGGVHSLGLKEGGLGVSDLDIVRYFAEIAAEQGKLPQGLTPDDVVRIVEEKRKEYISDTAWGLVERLQKDIIDGKIVFKTPATHDEYDQIVEALKGGDLQAVIQG